MVENSWENTSILSLNELQILRPLKTQLQYKGIIVLSYSCWLSQHGLDEFRSNLLGLTGSLNPAFQNNFFFIDYTIQDSINMPIHVFRPHWKHGRDQDSGGIEFIIGFSRVLGFWNWRAFHFIKNLIEKI